MNKDNASNIGRGKLTLSGVAAPGEPANSNQSLEADAARHLAAMSGNVKRNEIMLGQIIKPHFSAGAGAPERVDAVAKVIAPVAVQLALGAEQIVDLALFTDKVLPGQSMALQMEKRLAA